MLCTVCTLLNGNDQASNQAAEPSLSRKKKHPEVAYRTHELLYDYEEGESSDSVDATAAAGSGSSLDKGDTDSRARILDGDAKDEIGVSKRADEKQPLMTQSYPPRYNPGTPGEEGVCKTTEYRSQFIAYPRTPSEAVSTTRKSASMGFITQPAAKKGELADGDIAAVDGWIARPDENEDDEDAALDAVKRGRIKKTEYKAKFRPFSAYTYVDGNWKKATKLIKDNEPPVDVDPNSWYSEVVERLKKADQYRVRSHAGVPLYGDQQPIPPELIGHIRERPILSPVSVAASTSRTWKDERPSKERPRPPPAPVHHRKEKKDVTDSPEHPKSREGSTKKKPQVEKTTVRPKSAEPVIPHPKEHRSSPKHQPKSSRPRAPKDLPVHGHGDLSGKKKARAAEKLSPVGSKPRAVPRPGAAVSVVNGDDGKVWLKPDSAKDSEKEEEKEKAGDDMPAGGGDVVVNGYPESSKPDIDMVNGEVEDSVHDHDHTLDKDPPRATQQPITKPPIRVPLTTVKSPEEVTGVRSPDPESWTVPLEIGKGLHWMDGKTPGSASTEDTVDL